MWDLTAARHQFLQAHLLPRKKSAVAKAIARIHSEETGAPEFFVQVIIDENKYADQFLGGKLTTGHIWIRGDIRAGRTEEQRKELMLGIMKDMSQMLVSARTRSGSIYATSKRPIWSNTVVFLRRLATNKPGSKDCLNPCKTTSLGLGLRKRILSYKK